MISLSTFDNYCDALPFLMLLISSPIDMASSKSASVDNSAYSFPLKNSFLRPCISIILSAENAAFLMRTVVF
jgi:hypothetical protein